MQLDGLLLVGGSSGDGEVGCDTCRMGDWLCGQQDAFPGQIIASIRTWEQATRREVSSQSSCGKLDDVTSIPDNETIIDVDLPARYLIAQTSLS